MLKPSNLSKMLSKHSSNCAQIVFPSAHNIFNIREALRQVNYVSTPGFNVFALCKFTWNDVYISASEHSKDVQHVAKLLGTNDAFFWSLVQQGGYRPAARKLLSVTQMYKTLKIRDGLVPVIYNLTSSDISKPLICWLPIQMPALC